jgi:protein arginine kinase activator
MTCDRCKKRQAAVKYIEIEDGIKRSRWLCEICAAEEGAARPAEEDQGQEPLDTSLQAFLEGEPMAVDDEPDVAACPACGVTLKQWQETGLLGCQRCYPHFRTYLLPLLNRYHRSVSHLGKAPRARGPRAALRLEIGRLRSSLEVAVVREDFEEAARLRDEIALRQAELTAAEQSASRGPDDVS